MEEDGVVVFTGNVLGLGTIVLLFPGECYRRPGVAVRGGRVEAEFRKMLRRVRVGWVHGGAAVGHDEGGCGNVEDLVGVGEGGVCGPGEWRGVPHVDESPGLL